MDIFEQIATLPEERVTPYIAQVRSGLKQYLDEVTSSALFVEDNKLTPDWSISAQPSSYEDKLIQLVLEATLKVKRER